MITIGHVVPTQQTIHGFICNLISDVSREEHHIDNDQHGIRDYPSRLLANQKRKFALNMG